MTNFVLRWWPRVQIFFEVEGCNDGRGGGEGRREGEIDTEGESEKTQKSESWGGVTNGKRDPHITCTLHPPTPPTSQPHLENNKEPPALLRRFDSLLRRAFAPTAISCFFCVKLRFSNFWELPPGVLRSLAPKFAELASRVLQKFGTRSPKRVSEALLLVLLAVFFYFFFLNHCCL